MVKAGFIVEGASEKIIVESAAFLALLQSYGYELVKPVVDAGGGGNLLPRNIEAFISRLDTAEVDQIFILTDLEDEPHVEEVRDRVAHPRIRFAFVAVKALEAWYLADSQAMNTWLGTRDFFEPTPEQTQNKPWDRLKEIAAEHGVRGPGSKVTFANRAVRHLGFTVECSARHSECPSALELVNFLSSQNSPPASE